MKVFRAVGAAMSLSLLVAIAGCNSSDDCAKALCSIHDATPDTDGSSDPTCEILGCPEGQYCGPEETCLPGCDSPDDCGGAACINRECQGTPGAGVDILFVVDDSGSMAEEQSALAAAFPSFLDALQQAHGGLPDLHIAVVSTNLGAGPYTFAGCEGNGDNGAFRVGTEGCPQVAGAFITDVSDGAGGRIVNYTGTLAEAFACASQLGTNGCGFEQPLDSMRRALNGSNGANVGFLRPSAALAVVIVADEDDCSVEDTAMFDPSQDSIDSELGPLTSFRCFEFGVECDPHEPRTPGPKAGCDVHSNSPYMYGVAPYLEFLLTLQPPSRLAITVISGPATPVAVEPDPNTDNPLLAPSCESADGSAAPAVRLAALAAELPDTGSFGTICAPYATPLAELAADIAAMIE